MQLREGVLKPMGYEKVTGLTTAKALTVPTGARIALIKPETQGVRFRDDGTNPTATDGFLLDAGEEFIYTGKLATLRFIEAAATSTLHVSYYR